SRPVLIVVLIGSVHVDCQVENVAVSVAWRRKAKSLREMRKPAEGLTASLRCQALPFQWALTVNHTESLSALTSKCMAPTPTGSALHSTTGPEPSLGWRMVLCWPGVASTLR